jgi:hypothetical protein
LKCPKCDEEMMMLCRRDSSGFMDEVYNRCLSCGYMPDAEAPTQAARSVSRRPRSALSKTKLHDWRWKTVAATLLASIVLVSVMQIPVPVRVFAAEVPIDPVKDILPYVVLLNFSTTNFSLNYTEGQVSLRVAADHATVTSSMSDQNVTTYYMALGVVLINYQDAQTTLNMGFASLTMAITVRYQDLVANIDASTYMPLWTALVEKLTGQIP